MTARLTSQIGKILHQAETHGSIDDDISFDVMTDDLSDELCEAIAIELSLSPEFKGCIESKILDALRALRNDKNLDYWPAWSEYPKAIPRHLNERQRMILVHLAKVLIKIFDETNWTGLDQELGRLEQKANEFGINVDRLAEHVKTHHLFLETDEEIRSTMNRK